MYSIEDIGERRRAISPQFPELSWTEDRATEILGKIGRNEGGGSKEG